MAVGSDRPRTAPEPLAGQLTLADWEQELVRDAELATEANERGRVDAATREECRAEKPTPSPVDEPRTRQRLTSRGEVGSDDGFRERDLLTVAEVGRATGLSVNAVYRAIWCGELRASKLRGRLRVRDVDVDSWVEAARIGGEPARERRRAAARVQVARPHPGRGLRELLQPARVSGG
jgi:excisionase family DNA binding protein